jgi:hypothetical protein
MATAEARKGALMRSAQDAFDKGDMTTGLILQDQILAISDEQGARNDAEQPSESVVADEEPINWSNVTSEVETMLVLDARAPNPRKN